MVQAKPNNSIVTAKIKKISKSPANRNSMELLILSSEDAGQMTNFTRDKVGDTLIVFTTDDVSMIKPDETIQAEIRFKGDEFGGKFFASNVKKK